MIILTCRALQKVLDDRTILEEIKEDGQQIVFPANLIGAIESEDIESLMEIKDIKLEEGKKKTLLGFLDNEELEVAKLLESYKNERHKVVYTAKETRIKALIRIRKVDGQELSNKEYKVPQLYLKSDDFQLFRKGVDIKIDQDLKENSLVIINGYYAARYKNGKLLRPMQQAATGCVLDDPFVKYYNEGLKMEAKEAPLLIVLGDAGTGKTYMAINAALDGLESREYERVIITAPTVTIGGENIGYLPGEIFDKVIPFLGGFEDSIFKRLINTEEKNFKSSKTIAELRLEAKKKLQEHLESGEISIIPLGFLAGHSLDKCFIMADEMQNSNWSQLKALITRIGDGTKLVLMGDKQQSQTVSEINVLERLVNRWIDEPLCWKIDLSESRIRRSQIAGIAVRIM